MPRFSMTLIRALLALLATTLLVPSVSLAQSTKPFKATLAITELLQPVGGPPCFVLGHISGSGQAAHMGAVSVVSVDCVNPVDLLNPTVFGFSSNQFVLTAASGEQIFATYAGIFTIDGAVAAINGGYEITGGSGRFLNAKGRGIVQGLENLSVFPAQGEVQLTGDITY